MDKFLKILLVEDNLIEIMKMKRTISLLKLNHTIHEAKNGEEALKFLEDRANVPDIILLDLNMPDTNGIEFLTILKNDKNLKHIPTIVLTTSNNKQDINECYKIGIAGYYLKPLDYEDYEAKINAIIDTTSIILKEGSVIGKSKTTVSGYPKIDYFHDLENENTKTKLKQFYNRRFNKGNNKFLVGDFKETNKSFHEFTKSFYAKINEVMLSIVGLNK